MIWIIVVALWPPLSFPLAVLIGWEISRSRRESTMAFYGSRRACWAYEQYVWLGEVRPERN